MAEIADRALEEPPSRLDESIAAAAKKSGVLPIVSEVSHHSLLVGRIQAYRYCLAALALGDEARSVIEEKIAAGLAQANAIAQRNGWAKLS